MKPERIRDQLKSVGLARARMYLKGHLDWLDGAPVAQSPGQIVWRLRPRIGAIRAETIVVDQQLLRDSYFVLQKLTRRFPRALFQLVGDVSEWSEHVTEVLDRLSRAIHDDFNITHHSALPQEFLTRIERASIERLLHLTSSFAPLLKDIIWSGGYAPKVRKDLIHWINDNEAWIPEYFQVADPAWSKATLLLAADVCRSLATDIAALIKLTLARTDCLRTVTAGLSQELQWFTGQLRSWRHPRSIPTLSRQIRGVSFGQQISLIYQWLATQSQPVQQRAVYLATIVLSVSPLDSWNTAWKKFSAVAHTTVRKLCQLVKSGIGRNQFHAEACRVAHELQSELAGEPPQFPITEVLNQIKQIALNYSARFQQALCGLLTAVPARNNQPSISDDEIKLTLALLREATYFATERQAIHYFELSRKFLLSITSPNRLKPWEGLISSSNRSGHIWNSLRSTLTEDFDRHAQWTEYYRLLSRVVDHPCYQHDLNHQLAWLQLGSSNLDLAQHRFVELAKPGVLGDCSRNQIHAAIELETEGFPITVAITAIGPSSTVEDSCLTSILKLHRNFTLSGWPEVVRTLLRMKSVAELSHVARQFQIACSEASPLDFLSRPNSPALPDWAQYLPSSLHAQVALFSATFPQSRCRIQKILNKLCPDPQQLENEIAVLRQLQTTPTEADTHTEPGPSGRVSTELKRQRRLINLQQRLLNPLPVLESEVRRLQRQLEDALVIDLLRDAQARIIARLTTLLGGDSNREEFRRHMAPVRHLELVQGILTLTEPYRTLGLRLLRKCWGNIPWNLQQESPNRRFLDGLHSNGIRVESWLADRELMVPATNQRPRLSLAFETNEAEQLLMGYYFGTCLSPGDINFFSAVANAVDINKRVVYARDANGEVVGRCLFALGDAGTIVVFRPYCHDSNLGFTQLITEFANNLANEMGTVVSHTDHVSALLSPNWYDDGAYDLGNSIAADDSVVRLAIRDATEETVISALQTALAPVGLNNSMLEVMVQLPEFQQRPQLIRPLIPLIQSAEKHLGVSTLIEVALLADQAKIHDVASTILRRYALGWIRRQMNHGGYYKAMATIQILIAYHPSIALRSLRETRQRDIHCDNDESDQQRRQLLADCHQALGRPRLASELRSVES